MGPLWGKQWGQEDETRLPKHVDFVEDVGGGQCLDTRKRKTNHLSNLQVFFLACTDLDLLGAPVPPTYRRLANLGASGQAPQDAHRDLMTALGDQTKVSVEVELPFDAGSGEQAEMLQQSLLLPHTLPIYTHINKKLSGFCPGWQSQCSRFLGCCCWV